MFKKFIYFSCLILLLNLVSTSRAELVAYYSFDEGTGTTVADGSDNGYDGTIEGTLAWTEGAPDFGSALQFNDNVANYVDCGTFNPTDPGTGTLSMTAWVKWAGVGSANEFYSGIVGKGDANGRMFAWLIVETAHGTDPVRQVGATGFHESSAQPGPQYGSILTPQDEWIHLAVTFNGATGTLYADGEVSGTFTGMLDQNYADKSILIGNGTNTVYPQAFNGVIDELYIFNTVLTQADIQAAMNGTLIKITSATKPSPANKETDVTHDAALSWKPGYYAAEGGTHNVFIGTDINDVNNATIGQPLSVITAEGLDVNNFDPGSLEFGVTYYWRVDEVNAPSSPGSYKGQVWQFTVEPYA
ncbi:MAG: LamG domain-containing protein, partial [Sedimentisphaerales bacterium]|nr:LamG domain-containing protein [Sedimentisphaerales bacterium]